jgi:hypothetical protein
MENAFKDEPKIMAFEEPRENVIRRNVPKLNYPVLVFIKDKCHIDKANAITSIQIHFAWSREQ